MDAGVTEWEEADKIEINQCSIKYLSIMKNKFRITALVALLMFVTTTITNAQYARVNNRMTYPGQCLDIPGLTDVQMQKITAINNEHQKTIDNMRTDFYAAGDVITANNIKAKMTLEQNVHLKKISGELDEEQLKYFNANIIAGPAGGRGMATNAAGQAGGNNTAGYANTSGYTNTSGYGRGPCGAGYGRGAGRSAGRGVGRGAGRGMGSRNFNGRW
jgi:hypothetical protein